MNRPLRAAVVFSALLVCLPGFAGTFDSGGGISTGGAYQVTASLGGLGGKSSGGSVSNNGGGSVTEPTTVKTLSVTAAPSLVNEGVTAQLSGMATMDDDTVTVLAGSNITWNIPAWPIHGINASGIATTRCVYADTPATFGGSYLGVNASSSLLVLDSLPDNYSSYAGDGVPDWWQVQYFGTPPNPNAAADKDVTGTGQNNLFKYVAGLDPTNAASVFRLRIATVPGQPQLKNLIFSPRFPNRTYTPQYRLDLVTGNYTNLTDITTFDIDQERVVRDLSATQTNKFYRIKIICP